MMKVKLEINHFSMDISSDDNKMLATAISYLSAEIVDTLHSV